LTRLAAPDVIDPSTRKVDKEGGRVTAIPATEGPEAAQVGPPPPFDAELRSALDWSIG
jgi:hypothetical protein